MNNNKPASPGWPSINPGEFRHIIQIQQQPTGVDRLGQPVQVWPTILTCKGAINFDSKLADREFYQDGLLAARTMPTIMIRWTRLAKIMSGMRAYFVDQRFSPPSIHTYQIVFVENVGERDVLLKLTCFEINAQA